MIFQKYLKGTDYSPKMTKERIEWIDIAKSIGILLVVFGHSASPFTTIKRYIFWFHMPFFFFLSGYLYKARYNYWMYFKRKFLHLLVPYISFLILLSIPGYIRLFSDYLQTGSIYDIFYATARKIFGGRELTGTFAIFWFVTCLFFTQQVYNFLYTKLSSKKHLFLIIS